MLSYILHKIHLNGQQEVSRTEFADSLTIGRAETCEVRLESLNAALEHARVYIQNDQLFIQDNHSFSGTKLNGRLIQFSPLKEGDTVSIAGSEFFISREGKHWVVTERRVLKQNLSEDQVIVGMLKRLNLKDIFPSIWSISKVIIILCVLFTIAYPLLSGNKGLWSTGPIANKHAPISADCASCHQMPFQQVRDSSCLKCHSMSAHSLGIEDFHAAHPELNQSCASCHMEHNADSGLLLKDSRLCAECHSGLQEAFPETDLQDVLTLQEHPEFRISQLDDSGTLKRIPISDVSSVKENNSLKLNHEVHLKENIQGEDGYVTLGCESCHQLDDSREAFQSPTFEKDCKSCHQIQLEENGSALSIPHRKTDQVYQFLKAHFATGALDNQTASPESSLPRKRRTSTRSEESLVFERTQIEKQARSAESELFEKISCHLCHSITAKETFPSNESQYEIATVAIPKTWFPGAEFHHGAHDSLSCESCHSGVRDSQQTSDVLLPGVETCQNCHHDTGKNERVKTNCVMCHSFHNSQSLSPELRLILKHNGS